MRPENYILPTFSKKDTKFELEQFKSKLSSLQNNWSSLNNLWREAKIENDPFKTDEQIKQAEEELAPVLVELLNVDGEKRELLYSSAQKIRDEYAGPNIQVRGVIEVSNVCRENCLYCPMRKDNLPELNKKRISSEQIIQQAELANNSGIKELFIQGGEDRKIIPTVIDAVKMIKSNLDLKDLKIAINLGNHQDSDYLALAQAGVDGCLIKHETSDNDLHEKMRPGSTIEDRTSYLLQARKSGMYIGTGVIVGLPNQTDESLANDIIYAGRLGSKEMVSCSPFTASEETPLKGSPSGDFYKTLNMIAIYRHLFPGARIPSVSNLDNKLLTSRPDNLGISGQSMGIKAGANGVTINLTPPDMLNSYKIYDSSGKRHVVDFSKAQKISQETGLPLDIKNSNLEEVKELNNATKWSKIYQEQNPDKIPWNFEKIPNWFTEVIDSGWVQPGKTLDVGCGLGNYANYLAEQKGHTVLGIDFSEEAIKKDKEKFNNENLKFEVCDALNLKSVLDKNNPEMFDFVIDISLLHHIKPEAREKYAKSLADVTKEGSKVLISCFSESDPVFNHQKEFSNPDTDTVTYVLSKEDIVETFQKQFHIEALEEIEFGKPSKIGDSLTRKRHLVKLIRK